MPAARDQVLATAAMRAELPGKHKYIQPPTAPTSVPVASGAAQLGLLLTLHPYLQAAGASAFPVGTILDGLWV